MLMFPSSYRESSYRISVCCDDHDVESAALHKKNDELRYVMGETHKWVSSFSPAKESNALCYSNTLLMKRVPHSLDEKMNSTFFLSALHLNPDDKTWLKESVSLFLSPLF
jgi:hypothetical protein